jgi:hypothetical protein
MTKVTAYQAKDGKLFLNLRDMEDYERNVLIKSTIRGLASAIFNNGTRNGHPQTITGIDQMQVAITNTLETTNGVDLFKRVMDIIK